MVVVVVVVGAAAAAAAAAAVVVVVAVAAAVVVVVVMVVVAAVVVVVMSSAIGTRIVNHPPALMRGLQNRGSIKYSACEPTDTATTEQVKDPKRSVRIHFLIDGRRGCDEGE